MKGAPKAPAPIDPTKVIGAQENANFDTAQLQQLMNMMGTSNPFGSTSYNQTGTQMINGHEVPTYSQNMQLSPWAQSLMQPLDFSSNNKNLMQVQDPHLLEQNVSDAIYNQATSRLDPQWAKSNNAFADQLAGQGITVGSDAYDRAMADQSRSQNDAYTSAQNAATQAGEQAANQLFGQQLSGRQEGINEMLTGQNQPISALASMMAAMRGQTTPQTGVSPTNTNDAYSMYENQLQNQYLAQMQQYQSSMSGLGSLLGNAAMFAFI